mmetsp:Transcript_132213/g.233078  ORF Transcript_132213/g.233078 Transcript_132213/m.233078 type:complete len:218 (+) Transcript_132213:365-1018(+)
MLALDFASLSLLESEEHALSKAANSSSEPAFDSTSASCCAFSKLGTSFFICPDRSMLPLACWSVSFSAMSNTQETSTAPSVPSASNINASATAASAAADKETQSSSASASFSASATAATQAFSAFASVSATSMPSRGSVIARLSTAHAISPARAVALSRARTDSGGGASPEPAAVSAHRVSSDSLAPASSASTMTMAHGTPWLEGRTGCNQTPLFLA